MKLCEVMSCLAQKGCVCRHAPISWVAPQLAVSPNPGIKMIFSLDNLGLTMGSYGEDYDLPRGDCFHSGKDYPSSQREMPFNACVYGKVVNPINGTWGTVSVVPFGTSDMIQYLHCSRINVAVGDVVAPWTVLADTGEVCPPGTCNGIHLHLQVVGATGSPKYSCWSRNYLNPNTWSYTNPLQGLWALAWEDPGSPGSGVRSIETTANLTINSDRLLALNYMVLHQKLHVRTNSGLTCTLLGVTRWKVLFTAYTANGIKYRLIPDGWNSSTIPGNATCSPPNIVQHESEGELTLNAASTLRLEGVIGKRDFRRSSKALIDFSSVDFDSRLSDHDSRLTFEPPYTVIERDNHLLTENF